MDFNSLLFFIGAGLVALSVVLFVLVLILGKMKKLKLEQQLQQEYGDNVL